MLTLSRMREGHTMLWGKFAFVLLVLLSRCIQAELLSKDVIVEQIGNVLIPSPSSTLDTTMNVKIVFPKPFGHNNSNPLVVATPYFRSLDPIPSSVVVALTTHNVTVNGFDILVERIDVNLAWKEITLLVSWIAWDPNALPRSGVESRQGGTVPIPPEPVENFVGDVVLEFPQPFLEPPVIIATPRGPGGEPMTSFALTVSSVTENFAVLNVCNLGEIGSWINLVHVDWLAWSRRGASGSGVDYEVAVTSISNPQDTIKLSRYFQMQPIILTTLMNDVTTIKNYYVRKKIPAPAKTWDTYVSTLYNITSRDFRINVQRVYQTAVWRDAVQIGWIAINNSKICYDDCLGHGVCVEGVCHCDYNWRSLHEEDKTCNTCAVDFWGSECRPCPGYNQTAAGGSSSSCSGFHGTCDGSGTTAGTGECLCGAPYDGPACEACASGYYPDAAGTGVCDICPKVRDVICAGHGLCTEEMKQCSCEGHWGGTYCSECQKGYAGSDCETACPALCADRGVCVLEGDRPACECEPGWENSSFCQACAQGFYGASCDGQCPDCGMYGQCDDGMQGSGSCNCMNGYTSESFCRECDMGYFRDASSCVECPGGAANPCSGHGDPPGRCIDGLCICVAGYHGDDCSKVDNNSRGWAIILTIVLTFLVFTTVALLIVKAYQANSEYSPMDEEGSFLSRLFRPALERKGSRRPSYKKIDPELRKKLLEACPELKGMEENLSSLGSDAFDWLIDFSQLELGTRIGAGTSSLVYRGLYFDELVAIKKLEGGRCDPLHFGTFFRQEADLLSKLNHPNVVRFYGVCYHEGDFYLVTEFCENTLQRFLAQHHMVGMKLALPDLYRIAFQISKGMAYLHCKHVVHRDLKPENVLLDDKGDCKICDFGLSKLISIDTQMTVQVGTPAFMAPENALGTTDMSESVDVYSFGILLWSLCTCENPYSYLDVTPLQLLSRVVGGLRPRTDDASMPVELVRIMKACWEQDPSQRPTFQSLVSTFKELMQKEEEEILSSSGEDRNSFNSTI